MDLFELARTLQHDRDRSIEQNVRLRRLLARRTDLPGPAAEPVTRPPRTGRRSGQVAAGSGVSR